MRWHLRRLSPSFLHNNKTAYGQRIISLSGGCFIVCLSPSRVCIFVIITFASVKIRRFVFEKTQHLCGFLDFLLKIPFGNVIFTQPFRPERFYSFMTELLLRRHLVKCKLHLKQISVDRKFELSFLQIG